MTNIKHLINFEDNNITNLLIKLYENGYNCMITKRFPHIKYKGNRFVLYVPFIYGESYLTFVLTTSYFNVDEFIESIKRQQISYHEKLKE